MYKFNFKLSSTPIVYCDNICYGYLARNPIIHARTKHIEIDFHFIYGKISFRALTIECAPTKEQIEDVINKA